MKKIILFIFIVLGLSACKEDLTEFFDRADAREAANNALKQRNEEQARQNEEQARQNEEQARRNEELQSLNSGLRLQGEELRKRLADLEASMVVPVEPKLLSMSFAKAENGKLRGDIRCEIVDGNTIECWLPGMTADKQLIPRFSFEGTLVTIDGIEATSGETSFDFRKPVVVSVMTSDKKVNYMLYVHAFTGLPVLYITTEGKQDITSKDYYLNAQMKLQEDVKTRAAGDVIESAVQIKGRGNSTWEMVKKPYRLKFSQKISLLGEHKDKSWVLITNYPDKTMLRNHVAYFLSSISNLEYTPKSHFVELVLNDKYHGTYELCEKVEVAGHRVAVGDDGFLLEIDIRAPNESDSRYFYTTRLENPVSIKEPEVEYDDANFNYARNFVKEAEVALFSSDFRNKETGWQKYLDMESFVDWYLINEIAKNPDGDFRTSCFMNLTRGGKLKMGPVWDFDVSFGNISNDVSQKHTGFRIKNVMWYAQLFRDPAFVARVKERFAYFYNHRNDLLSAINQDAQYLKYSVEENNSKWNTLYSYTWTNYNIWGSYKNEVQSLKEWIELRMAWMKIQFDGM